MIRALYPPLQDDTTDTHCCLGWSDTQVVIAFRGTQTMQVGGLADVRPSVQAGGSMGWLADHASRGEAVGGMQAAGRAATSAAMPAPPPYVPLTCRLGS